jgi:hypothetical protein
MEIIWPILLSPGSLISDQLITTNLQPRKERSFSASLSAMSALLPCFRAYRFSTMYNGYYIKSNPTPRRDPWMIECRNRCPVEIDVVRLGIVWLDATEGQVGWSLQPRHLFAFHGDPRTRDCHRWHKECNVFFGRAWQAT